MYCLPCLLVCGHDVASKVTTYYQKHGRKCRHAPAFFHWYYNYLVCNGLQAPFTKAVPQEFVHLLENTASQPTNLYLMPSATKNNTPAALLLQFHLWLAPQLPQLVYLLLVWNTQALFFRYFLSEPFVYHWGDDKRCREIWISIFLWNSFTSTEARKGQFFCLCCSHHHRSVWATTHPAFTFQTWRFACSW